MAAERTPVDFGRKLRDARERKGVSLRQIASATKISVAVLDALERNDISRLPGGIFGRAFVRSYAIEVGLDPEETIQDFIAQFPHDSVTAGHPTSEQVDDHEAVESDRRMASTFLVLILISIPIAGGVVYLSTSGSRFIHRTAPAPAAQVADPPKPAPAPEPAAPSPASASASTSAAPPAPAPESVAEDRLTVGLSVKRPCWVSATVDGQKTIERLLQAGETQTIDVKREMVLTAGDASAIAMTLNGADAKPLGKTGEVVTRRVNLTNFKDFLQTAR
ncbi:MAG TPA: helix-turn-helix domain-containing protein [Vicinamibacterales bacterium]|nr:helix-turn-helix domain-containing protein [Vicinamibacterales bacterium]